MESNFNLRVEKPLFFLNISSQMTESPHVCQVHVCALSDHGMSLTATRVMEKVPPF